MTILFKNALTKIRIFPVLAIMFTALLLQGCVVAAIVDTAATVAVKTVGLAADATIGTVKLVGRAVGLGGDKKPDEKAEPSK